MVTGDGVINDQMAGQKALREKDMPTSCIIEAQKMILHNSVSVVCDGD